MDCDARVASEGGALGGGVGVAATSFEARTCARSSARCSFALSATVDPVSAEPLPVLELPAESLPWPADAGAVGTVEHAASGDPVPEPMPEPEVLAEEDPTVWSLTQPSSG